MYVDTHTHLYSEQFDTDRQACIERAFDKGVTKLVLPAIDASYTERMWDLKQRYPDNMFLMAGLHPTHVKDNYREELAHVKSQLSQSVHHYCAVGEIGIDLYWDRTFLKQQQEAFQQQIQWAKQYQLPIAIHARESFDEIFEILETEQSPDLRGVLHCFTGTLEQAWQAIDYGMSLGIGGVVTFKNGKIDRFLHDIPLQHIVLETDAPYLAPTPYRGKRNESAYIPMIADKLADIYKMSTQEIVKITTDNAKQLFRI